MRYLFVAALIAMPVLVGAQEVGASRDSSPSFDFKGRRLGDSVSVRPRMRCSKDRELGIESCFGSERIADSMVITTHVYLDGRLIYLGFDYKADDFDALRPAFEAKYGAPATAAESPYVTVAGHQYDQVLLTWRLREGSLQMMKRGDRADWGTAHIADEAGTATWAERKKAKAESTAKRDM